MPFLINHVNHNSDSLASLNNMSVSLLPFVAYQAHHTPTPDLEYAEEVSPPILFGTTEHVQPIYLWPLKLEDDEILDENKSILPSSGSPTIFNEAYPTQVRIKVEEFKKTHNTREVEAKDQQATSCPAECVSTDAVAI
jgi:hypothetical protein